MRIAVVGAGALGGFLGGLLARAEARVTFVARGRALASLQRHGVTCRPNRGDAFTLPVAVTADPHEVGPVDLVLLAVKMHDLDGAIETARPLVGPATAVLCVQNGIDAPGRVAAAFGEAAVIAGAIYLSATVESPGVYVQIGDPGFIHLGELHVGRTPRLESVAALFERGGLPAERHDDVWRPLWTKFMAICAFSGVTALTRLPLRQVLACPETRTLYRDVLDEVVTLAAAEGAPLPASAADEHMELLRQLERLPERGSMAYDLLAGRRIEIDALNGAVVQRGKAAGLPTPCNRVIYAALLPFANGAPDDA